MRFKLGILVSVLFPAFLLFFCGCATTVPENLVSVSGPEWRVQQGQALWTPRTGAPQFGGDLVVATNDGSSFVQFSKTPLTIVTTELTPKHWLLRFPEHGKAWEGRRPAPARTIWLYLADALAGKRLPGAFRFEQEPNGNWKLEDVKTGEILEGFLSS
ncbi:MAG TPA: hypothetical protein VMF08_01870 [Candidatus Sulfotelmatobacter sp.]|nr:hypothetical protein [Candidatus Sulfotelmatobacter sp.]